MAYQSVSGVPTVVTLSSADSATLKAYVSAQQAAGGVFVGYSDAQVAAALNCVSKIPNPQPRATSQAGSMARTAVLSALTNFIVEATAAGSAGAVAVLNILQTGVQGNPLDPIPTADILQFAAAVKAAGYDPTAQIDAALTVEDPNWQANITLSAWAPRSLSAPTWLAAADVAAALAG